MVLLQGNLPLSESMTAKPSSWTAKTHGEGHRAWQNAMEQAQLADWFKPGVDPRDECVTRRTPPATPESGFKSVCEVALPETAARLRYPAASHDVARPRSQYSASGIALHANGAIADLEYVRTVDGPTPFPPESRANRAQEAGLARGASTESITDVDVHAEIARYLADAIHAHPQLDSLSHVSHLAAIGTAASCRVVNAFAKSEVGTTHSPPQVASPAAPHEIAPAFGNGVQMQVQRAVPSDGEEAVVQVSRQMAIRSVTGEEPALPIRVHVDWSEHGVRIWLGVSHEASMSAHGLAKHLDQWLAAGGIKLALFVCNGRPIYTRYPAGRSFE